jgi:hypothetical protein
VTTLALSTLICQRMVCPLLQSAVQVVYAKKKPRKQIEITIKNQYLITRVL